MYSRTGAWERDDNRQVRRWSEVMLQMAFTEFRQPKRVLLHRITIWKTFSYLMP